MSAIHEIVKHPSVLELYKNLDKRFYKMLGGDIPPSMRRELLAFLQDVVCVVAPIIEQSAYTRAAVICREAGYMRTAYDLERLESDYAAS